MRTFQGLFSSVTTSRPLQFLLGRQRHTPVLGADDLAGLHLCLQLSNRGKKRQTEITVVGECQVMHCE